MYYILAAEFNLADYIPVIIQVLVTAGVIFGGTGYWQYKQAKEQAKRDEESKENGIEKKMDTLTENMTQLNNKVDHLSSDVKELKQDIELLQRANEETVKYRNIRDTADKEALEVQKAVIESLKGLMRERLLDIYKRCTKKGYYTQEEREVYKPLYECYIREPFHGNGVMQDLHDIMVRMPLTAEGAGIFNDDDSDD